LSKSSLSQSVLPPPGYDLISFQPAPISKHIEKSLYLLGITIDNLFRRHSVTHVAFVTLTFPTPVSSPQEAHRRLNIFLNAIRMRGLDYLWVLEPHQKEGLHYHLLVVLPFDCHVGTRVEYWADNPEDDLKREMMNPQLRAEYDWWTATAPRYGFGRIDLAPIYSNPEAIRKYLCKMEWRHDHWVFQEVKRLRFWNHSRHLKSGNAQFSWNTSGSREGRARMAAWAAEYGCDSREAIKALLGSSWGFRYLCATGAPRRVPYVPQSYIMVPSANSKITGESASADETESKLAFGRLVTTGQSFEGLGRRLCQAPDPEKQGTDDHACRAPTAPNPPFHIYMAARTPSPLLP